MEGAVTAQRLYVGSIEAVLNSGEYAQGDLVQVTFDELVDLVEQAKLFKAWWEREQYTKCVHIKGVTPIEHERECDFVLEGIKYMEQKLNRPVHPALGGQSLYSHFLPF